LSTLAGGGPVGAATASAPCTSRKDVTERVFAIVGDLEILRGQIGDGFAVFVANDHVEHHLFGSALDNRSVSSQAQKGLRS
jgi:hypothetical protein